MKAARKAFFDRRIKEREQMGIPFHESILIKLDKQWQKIKMKEAANKKQSKEEHPNQISSYPCNNKDCVGTKVLAESGLGYECAECGDWDWSSS